MFRLSSAFSARRFFSSTPSKAPQSPAVASSTTNAASARPMLSKTIPSNYLKLKFKKDPHFVAVGCMLAEVRQASVVQVLRNAGADFVIIDNEHGPFNIETIADLSRASVNIGVTPIVRVPSVDDVSAISRVLDAGAQGVLLPQVVHHAQVRAAVGKARFPPQGTRGNALVRGYSRFTTDEVPAVMHSSNVQTMVIAQVETLNAVEHLEKIASVPGLDALLVGPNDLAIALGVPGELDHPRMHEAIRKVIAVCKRYNLYPAIHVNNLASAQFWKAKGMRIISVGSEMSYLFKGVNQVCFLLHDKNKSKTSPEVPAASETAAPVANGGDTESGAKPSA